MSEISENQVIAALTFKVPQKIGWSVQRGEQSWTGNEISGLADCLRQKAQAHPVVLSLSLIVELPENGGPVRLSDNLPKF